MPNPNPNLLHLSEQHSSTPTVSPEVKEKKKIPVANHADSGTRQILRTVLSNTVVLGCDFATTSIPYGTALKAEALVKKPRLRDFFNPTEIREAYKRSWGVLKFGFYPTYLMQVAATETVKNFGSPMLSKYSEDVMPGIIGAGTAPAVSFAAINARYKLNLDLAQVFRQKGIRGVTKFSGGYTAIGIRELLCYKALNHDTTELAKKISDTASQHFPMLAPLFRNKEGLPTLMSKAIASTPDGLALLASQPLTMFAVNASTLKYQRMQSGTHQRPTFTSPVALLNWHLQFARAVCQQIVNEGSKTGLSSFFSFSPGVVARTLSLFGTLAVFKYALDPVSQVVGDNITHRKRSQS